MPLKQQQVETVKQQLATAVDVDDLIKRDPQLGELLAKHFTLFVGADVCSVSFEMVVKNAAFEVVGSDEFDNHHDGFVQFLHRLDTLNANQSLTVQVAIECTGPYHLALVRFLKAQGIEVYLYNGQTAKHLAKAYLKEKKTDRLDADILANLLIDGKFPTSITPDENPFIEIRNLSRRSQKYAEQIGCAKTRLKDELTQASVGMLRVFPKQAVFNKAPMYLMKLYPLPTDRLAVGLDKVAKVLAEQSGNKYGKLQAQKLLNFDAKNHPDTRLFDYFRQSIRDYIDEIHDLQDRRERYLTQITEKTKDQEPAQHLLSLKGCGKILMPIVLSEVGNISRFPCADRFVGYAGLAPIEHESGPYKGEKRLKKGGSPRLSYACYTIANCARRYDKRLKGLYQRVKQRHIGAGKPTGIAHLIANCAVAREIAVLIYSILKENRPYFENQKDYKAYRAAEQQAA